MQELGGYVRDSIAMELPAFARAHPASVLLVDKADFDDEPGNVAFETVVIPLRHDPRTQGYWVFPIAKNKDNPWPDRISVGRARNCDVVLRHASVSKLHAHFFLQGSVLRLADAKSTNGCSINGRALTEGERVPLACGDELSLGMIEATLYSPAGLFRFIQDFRESA